MAPAPQPRPARNLYRTMREWHGYVSAFAFLWMLFFAVTGILLNHPGLLRADAPPLASRTIALSPAEVAAIRAAPKPAERLVATIGAKTKLKGALTSGDVVGDEIFARMQGAGGTSDVRASLAAGTAEVTVEARPALAVLNELHRGELAGSAWRLMIDIAAGSLIVAAVAGFILFFSLRFRLRTVLILVGVSAAVATAVFVAMVR